MIYQFEVTFVTWQSIGRTAIQNVLKHLIGFRPNYANRSVANLYRWAWRRRRRAKREKLRQRSFRSRTNPFHQLHRRFIWRSPDITGANVVIIRKNAGEISVGLNSTRPILRRTRAQLILL